ncbi:MAG TPA: serine hydrolase domain-containing protein [Anaerolineae bacterium]|nr:serine hydrolase domain-containing protein [Anaerolineae bacterium]
MIKKILLLSIAFTLLSTGCGQPEAPPIELVPFTSQAWSVRGVAPEGWMEVNPGHFSGGAWPFKQLLVEAYPGQTAEVVIPTALLPRLGVDPLPEPTGAVESGVLAWELYAKEVPASDGMSAMVDLAITETDSGVYVVVLITGREDKGPLREAVFLPAVQALEPIRFDQRDRVTAEELLAPDCQGVSPVNHAFFLPMGDAAPALHELEGTLVVPEFKMLDTVSAAQIRRSSEKTFPGFSAEFFTYGDNLVPVQREVILSPGKKSFWRIILSPGKVWSEPGDGGLSRASFPFVLVAPDTNETHNGVATFLYDEAQVSSFRFQVGQETAAWRQEDYWGQSSMEYRPGLLQDREALRAQFEQERKGQTPIRPWSDLEGDYDPQLLSRFNGDILPWSLSASGLILDNTLYLQPCRTRYGPFPYCEAMRHGAFSVTKSMGAAIAMLRLAEKFGPEIFDLKIADYVDITAGHDGWVEVTFADALNMATGIGDDLPERVEPNVMLADEEGDEKIFNGFLQAMSAQEKADICFTAGDYPWDPGEVARYNSCHTFILSMAMDSFLKSMEGPDADIWDMVMEEVFRPIGIYHAPMMRTIEPDGSRGIPQFWVGLYPAVDDVAKVAILLQNGGQHQGQQILHPGKLAEALRQAGFAGLPTGETNEAGEGAYHMSFWSMPYRSTAGDLFQIPYMSGFGGNRVILNPNGITTFQFADAHIYGFESMVKVADGMEPFTTP